MNSERFNQILEEQIKRSTDMLVKKAGEYATEGDRLHNFVVAGQLQGQTPRQALAGMMAKHTVSVYDMATSTDDFSDDQWNEKITDHINYLLLLRAVIAEERSHNVVSQILEDLDNMDNTVVSIPVETIKFHPGPGKNIMHVPPEWIKGYEAYVANPYRPLDWYQKQNNVEFVTGWLYARVNSKA